MPITITLPVPETSVGPGYRVQLESSVPGPYPAGSFFLVTIGKESEGTPSVLKMAIPSTSSQVSFVVGERSITTDKSDDESIAAGATVSVIAELRHQDQTVIDSGRQDATYDPINYLWALINTIPASQVTGGFTAQDRVTLEETNQLSLAVQAATQVVLQVNGQPFITTVGQMLAPGLLDRLTTSSLSNGITCDPVRYDASGNFFYGVQLLITDFPPDWKFGTPDQGWGFHDLAVLSFHRGGVGLARLGIHTTETTVYPLPGNFMPWILPNVPIPMQPPDYHIWVDWAEGVCGELRGLALP